MVKIQIEGGYLDVAGDVNFPLNFSAQDIKDISARKGGFSKTIILVGNQNNIDLLGSLYDVNVEQMTFNTNKLTKCAIIQNGIVIAENMLLQITGIEKNSTSTTVVDSFTFTANVKDSVADFFTIIANSMISDIDLSQYNHVLNATNVLATFGNTSANGYKYFPFYTPTNIIPIREMIPSVYVKTYMDRIFAKAGKSYNVVNSAKFNFDKLVVPMSITDANINAGDEVLEMGFSYFDEQAKRHIRYLVADIKKGEKRWQYFDEITRKREELTPYEEPKVKRTIS